MSEIACLLGFDVTEPAELVLQIAPPSPLTETLSVEADELPGRQHYLRAEPGKLIIEYRATVGELPPPAPVSPLDRIVALRPSRYCPSDRLGGFAANLFGGADDPAAAVRAITDWVHDHLFYTVGSSGPSTDAVDTLLSGAGVCRDYAHLTATLCRALDIPARVAAVYAPGLSPMDFHLVVETALDGVWRVWDSTRLAPRQSLIRIVNGRDAADTALATTLSGVLTLSEMSILAVADGDLPIDDHTSLVSLS
ncbi:transglutaminase-like putative cysteine protease [Actinoplanes tereljensis]|uniref:Transglutaminase-like protein n=1 Tax=Paractinoplanes tereljensis TaxID=571912 RepID=A0A919NG97_9ACTN|nr:transglutaminase-like domain-containing protein [Actinoplanes tereljensis]GIF17610.1 putative transglutaminase-like protein [Actinoplanes tereljensis]